MQKPSVRNQRQFSSLINVVLTMLIGALAFGCFVSPFILFAIFIYGDGGNWCAPLALAIAEGASWPSCRWFGSVNDHPRIGQLALLGFAQWMSIGGVVGLVLGGIAAALRRFASKGLDRS
jgi:hypothetical protein